MSFLPRSRWVVSGLVLLAIGAATASAMRLRIPVNIPWIAGERPGPEARGAVRLHSNWRITPAGTGETTGDLLIGSALSPDRKTLALVSAGNKDHTLYLTDAATGKIRQSVPLERAWNGVAWSPDSRTVYVSGGSLPQIHVLRAGADGSFRPAAPIVLPDLGLNQTRTAQGETVTPPEKVAYVSGLAATSDGKTLYAINFVTDAVYAISLPERRVLVKRQLDAGARPYCARLAPDGKSLFVSLMAARSVLALDPATLETRRTIPVGSHPNDILFHGDGRMFVSCGNEDAVYALNPATGEVRERIVTAISPQAPVGATPSALALTPDGKTLFVANSDNNAVAVVDVAKADRSEVEGFIPTGWYPTAVAVSPDGRRLFIGTGKGMGTTANPPTDPPVDGTPGRQYTYIASMLTGMISALPVPDAKALEGYTRQVLQNMPYRDAALKIPVNAPAPGTNPIPSRAGDASPIKYVLYIIKENRTYDQVLGDLKDADGKPRGNGDPKLTLFGEEITPNQHQLAREFVTLDNLYCSGEVSGNGHPMSTAAYSPEINERAWILQYSSKAKMPMTDRMLQGPVGRIWDVCEKQGIPWASYYTTWTTDNTRTNMPEAWKEGLKRDARDYEFADIFIADLKKYEESGKMPRFMIMALPEDHTNGTRPGSFTPNADVASNDLAVGKIVEACSKSRYWKEMAIFIIQDDAQAGPDHVDAHRTIGQVISPYTRRGKVDSSFYTTASMLRTMELVLGLPPMSQLDAGAAPMYAAFGATPDLTPYVCREPRVDLNAKNPTTAYGATQSLALDFSGVDRLTEKDEDTLNRILWHSIKGAKTPYPGIVRRAMMGSEGRPILAEEAE